METEKDARIKVAIRVRPKNNAAERYAVKCVSRLSDESVAVQRVDGDIRTREREQREFMYDFVFDESTAQADFYNEAAESMVQSVLEGHNATIFAYGQTGSGKTFTILGEVHEDCRLHPNSGLFLRSMKDLFDYKERVKDIQHIVITLSVIEIYVDEVRDLLKEKAKMVLRDTGDDVLIPNLSRHVVSSMDEVYRHFKVANSQRAVISHKLNDVSSRSHAVFLVDVVQQERKAANPNPPSSDLVIAIASGTHDASKNDSGAQLTCSRFTIVDLAGSERIKQTGVTGQGLEEARSINKSLFTLKLVVKNMYNGTRVSYRDSSLTRILKNSFVAPTSKVLVVANVSPTNISYDQTLSTLRFANEIKELRNIDLPLVNPEAEAKYLRSLRKVEELAAELRIAEAVHKCRRLPVDKLLSTDVAVLIDEERKYAQSVEQEKSKKEEEEEKAKIEELTRSAREKIEIEINKLSSTLRGLEKQNTDLETKIKSLTADADRAEKQAIDETEELRQTRKKLQETYREKAKDVTRLRSLAGVGMVKGTTWESECEAWLGENAFHAACQRFQEKVLSVRKLQLHYFKLRCRVRPNTKEEQGEDNVDSDVSDISMDDDVNVIKSAENAEVNEQERLASLYESERLPSMLAPFLESGCVVKHQGVLRTLALRDTTLVWIDTDASGVADTKAFSSLDKITGIVFGDAPRTFTLMLKGQSAGVLLECMSLGDFDAVISRLSHLRSTIPTFANPSTGTDEASVCKRIGCTVQEFQKILKYLTTVRQENETLREEHVVVSGTLSKLTKGSLRVLLEPFQMDCFRCQQIYAYLERNNLLW